MSSEVERLMEAMVPELKEFESENLLTSEELRILIQRRRDMEYKLQRV